MAPEVQDLILAQLNSISKALDELRADFHDKLMLMSGEISTLKQWKESHEKMADDNIATIKGLAKSRDQLSGALKAIAFFEALVGVAVAVLGWVHFRK